MSELHHVAFGGKLESDEFPAFETLEEALATYGWQRMVEADGILEAIQQANDEAGEALNKGEVYFVTPFVQMPTQKIEVLVQV